MVYNEGKGGNIMPPKPKIQTKEHIEILRRTYLIEKMSTRDIAKQSVELFGFKVSNIYSALVRNNIPIRSTGDGISVAMSTLDTQKSFLNEKTQEWIDGFLLGDGSINFKHEANYRGARFTFGSVQKEWTEFAAKGLKDYNPCEPKAFGKKSEKRPNNTWSFSTLTHPDICNQAKRWYPQSKHYVKHIPEDVRITPVSVLLWYLGDGSITKYGVSYVVRLATCSFAHEDIDNILIPKLKSVGIESIRTKDKNDVKIATNSTGTFFDYIGIKSPISCYNYKFEYAPWLDLYRVSDIARNKKEAWRIQYLYKCGKLDCSKSPGDKLLLFNEEQKNKLLQILDNHTPHSDYEVITTKESSLIRVADIVKNDIERWNARYMITRGIVEHEPKSMLTSEQAKRLREKLDVYGNESAIPEHLVNIEFQKYRELGFPYYNFSQEDKISKIKRLCSVPSLNGDGYYWDGFGCELANCFHPHMFSCNKKGKMSAINFFNSDKDFKRGIAKLIALYGKITPAKIREICCNEAASSRINNFPPKVMSTILHHLYNGEKINLLDPCAGFSGRLIGSYASGIVDTYTGIDLSPETYNGLLKTKEFIDSLNGDFNSNILFGNCLEVMPTLAESADFIFTSPPFLDEEQYMKVPVETDYNRWREIFIEPFIRGANIALKSGGKLAVYTEAIRRNDFPKDFCNMAESLGFARCPDIPFKMACRENLRRFRADRTVNVLVFQKP